MHATASVRSDPPPGVVIAVVLVVITLLFLGFRVWGLGFRAITLLL